MKCEYCGKEHDGNYASGRFCSKECAKGFATKKDRTEINKRLSIVNGGTGILKEKLTHCLYCGAELKGTRKFCNGAHSAKFKQQELWNEVEKIKEWPGPGNNGSARIYLIAKHGHKCELCNETKWQGQPIPLVLDHIDGNSDNYKLNNIRMICRNCDGLLPTFSGRNVGKGRHTKRMASKKARREKGMSW